jgi:hypothetical protein
MAGCDLLAEEGHKPAALMKHRVEPRAGGVALDDEWELEDRELQHRCGRESPLQRTVSHLRMWTPSEPILVE